MENYKISKLLNNLTVSKFLTKKLIKVNNFSSAQYSVNKNIRFKTSMLWSDLCDYSDAYIVVKGKITLEGDNDGKRGKKKPAFKNNASFNARILLLLCQCIIC